VGDVLQHGKIVDHITVQRRNMKGGKAGKTSSRMVALPPEARAAPSVWLEVLTMMLKGILDPMTPVLCSRVRDTASGKLGTHAIRKTSCNRVYDLLKHDLVKTQRAMGYANVNSTVQYLSFREEEIDAALLAA
jgi:hypothetical protein